MNSSSFPERLEASLLYLPSKLSKVLRSPKISSMVSSIGHKESSLCNPPNGQSVDVVVVSICCVVVSACSVVETTVVFEGSSVTSIGSPFSLVTVVVDSGLVVVEFSVVVVSSSVVVVGSSLVVVSIGIVTVVVPSCGVVLGQVVSSVMISVVVGHAVSLSTSPDGQRHVYSW